MVVTILYEGKTRKGKGVTVADALRSARINPQNVLARIGGRIVSDDTKVKKGQKIEALKVVSGG
jgi:sulfur carrier protein ThiS